LGERAVRCLFKRQHRGVAAWQLQFTMAAALLALSLHCVDAMRGDRPGQLRYNAFSSFGHHGKKATNDPRMWPEKFKKSKDEVEKLTFIYVAPGTREAMALHNTDVSLKALKHAKRTRSLSARSRSRSCSVAGSVGGARSKSRSSLAQTNKAKLLTFFEDDATHSKFELLRMLRMSHMHRQDLPPAGLWTAKSRPASLLSEETKKRKLTMRKKLQILARKGKNLKGAAKSAAKSAHKSKSKRSGSSRARSSSVKSS